MIEGSEPMRLVSTRTSRKRERKQAMFDEESQKPASGFRLGANLDAWSVSDLDELHVNLLMELARVKGEIDRKKGRRSSAEFLFKA